MPRNPPDPASERRRTPCAAPGWAETVTLDGRDERTGLAVAVTWVVADASGRGGIDVRVRRPGLDAVVVIDDDLPAALNGRFEVRAPALWADLVVETPLRHVTFGLEAFGVEIDDPADAGPDARGVRTPVGLDLEWESDGPAEALAAPEGYVIASRVHGEVLLGHDAFELDGPGHRSHSWRPVPGSR